MADRGKKGGKEIQKFEYLQNDNKKLDEIFVLDEIKSIFVSF